MKSKHIHWKLDTTDPIEAENPLGYVSIDGAVGRIEIRETFLDAVLEAFIVGVREIELKGEASVDLVDEPHSIRIERCSCGFRIRYRGQAAEILDEAGFRADLRIVTGDVLRQLDHSKRAEDEPVLELPVLRDFFANGQ